MRGEERRRGDIKQEGLLWQEGAAGGAKIMAPSLDGWRRRGGGVVRGKKKEGDEIDQMQRRLIRGREETDKHAGSTEQTPKRVSPAVTNPRIVTDSRNGGSGPNALRAWPSTLMGGNNIYIFFLFVVKHLESHFFNVRCYTNNGLFDLILIFTKVAAAGKKYVEFVEPSGRKQKNKNLTRLGGCHFTTQKTKHFLWIGSLKPFLQFISWRPLVGSGKKRNVEGEDKTLYSLPFWPSTNRICFSVSWVSW